MGVSSVSGSSDSRALKESDREVSRKRAVNKDSDNKESDNRTRRAQDDDKGRRVDTEA